MRCTISLFFLLLWSVSFAQVIKPISEDSIPTEIYLINESASHFSVDSLTDFLDTSNAPLLNQPPIFYNHELNLGNYGTPQYHLSHQKFSQQLGFFGQFDHLDRFRYSGESYPTIILNKPYTVFQYLNGSAEEERFSVMHTQPIGEFAHVGFDYHSLTSTGFYSRQRTQHRNVALFGNYVNPNSGYDGSVKFFFNRATLLENGGISNATDLSDESFGLEFIPIQLEQARNGSQNREVFVFQKFHFFKPYIVPKTVDTFRVDSMTVDSLLLDSLVWDSVNTEVPESNKPDLYLYHKGSYFDGKYDFAVSPAIGNEIRSKYEQSYTHQRVGIAFNELGFKEFFINGDVSLTYQNGSVETFVDATPYENLLFSVKGNLVLSKLFTVGLLSNQVMSGFNQGDFKQYIWGSFQTNKLKLKVTGLFQETGAPFVYRRFYASRDSLDWNSTFSKELVSAYRVEAQFFDKIELLFENGNHQNLLYFDPSGLPQQAALGMNYLKINASAKLRFGMFSWFPNVTYQQYSLPEFPMPEWVIFNRLSIGGWLFNQHMKADFGVDLFFTTGFDGYQYAPLTRQFTLNGTSTQLGNYPFVDVFFSAKVKTATFFLRASHVNAGFSGSDYFTAALYPYHPFSFRMGFRWMFLY